MTSRTDVLPRLLRRCVLLAATFVLSASALAQVAYTTRGVNMRAGPDGQYPQVAWLPSGVQVNVVGCVDGWRWCDVAAGPNRGWVYSEFLAYPYQNRQVPIITGGSILGLPLVTFFGRPVLGQLLPGAAVVRQPVLLVQQAHALLPAAAAGISPAAATVSAAALPAGPGRPPGYGQPPHQPGYGQPGYGRPPNNGGQPPNTGQPPMGRPPQGGQPPNTGQPPGGRPPSGGQPPNTGQPPGGRPPGGGGRPPSSEPYNGSQQQ